MTPLMAALLAGMILCYLVCGIPFGLVIAKLHGIDVRSVGSHNIGATNVGRSVGVKAAVATLIADAAKALLCMVLARQLVANIAFGGDYAMTNPQTSFVVISLVPISIFMVEREFLQVLVPPLVFGLLYP